MVDFVSYFLYHTIRATDGEYNMCKNTLLAILLFISNYTPVLAYVDKYDPHESVGLWGFYGYLILIAIGIVIHLVKKFTNKQQKHFDSSENYKQKEHLFNELLDKELEPFSKNNIVWLIKDLCQRSLIATMVNNNHIDKKYVKESIILALNAIIAANEKPEWVKEAKKLLQTFDTTK
ncbi:MAG: hypothetical protein MJ164_04100 [Alphaproteobacteria bacterium]|nr:hypothetical protein [Alphaproteobacteria bacterium]